MNTFAPKMQLKSEKEQSGKKVSGQNISCFARFFEVLK